MDEVKKVKSTSVEKWVPETMRMLMKLTPEEFLGVCTILGVKIYEEDLKGEEEYIDSMSSQVSDEEKIGSDILETDVAPAEGYNDKNLDKTPREGSDLIQDVIVAIMQLNRTRRRNLKKLLKTATKRR